MYEIVCDYRTYHTFVNWINTFRNSNARDKHLEGNQVLSKLFAHRLVVSFSPLQWTVSNKPWLTESRWAGQVYSESGLDYSDLCNAWISRTSRYRQRPRLEVKFRTSGRSLLIFVKTIVGRFRAFINSFVTLKRKLAQNEHYARCKLYVDIA